MTDPVRGEMSTVYGPFDTGENAREAIESPPHNPAVPVGSLAYAVVLTRESQVDE